MIMFRKWVCVWQRLSHRPNLPYSFNVSNANYVNAYAFPGGSIVATRAIMLELDNEAQLAPC